MTNRGMKRICASCGIKFYDMAKLPVVCPSCGAEFTGEVQVKSRRSRSTIVPDTVRREDIEAKNKGLAMSDDETISLDDLDEGDDDDLDDDLGIDDLDDDLDDDDDLSDLDGDIAIDVDKDDL